MACTVERGTEAPSEIKLTLSPKVTFEKGKATAALQAQGFAQLMADVARMPLDTLYKAG